MLAVGGYGRRELFPYSDIDIMILLDNESLAGAIKEPLSEFMRLLWDAGLRLSHSVRTVNDCTEVHDGNPELNVSLLDRRLLGGDEQVNAGSKPACRCFSPSKGTDWRGICAS